MCVLSVWPAIGRFLHVAIDHDEKLNYVLGVKDLHMYMHVYRMVLSKLHMY